MWCKYQLIINNHTNALIIMRKKVTMLSCIAAVAIASFVGKKAFEPHAYETNDLQNEKFTPRAWTHSCL